MLHIRRLYIVIMTLVTFVLVVILLQTNSFRMDIIPGGSSQTQEKLSKIDPVEISLDSWKQLKVKKLSSHLQRVNKTKSKSQKNSSINTDYIERIKIQSRDTNLLEDNQLKEGEISDSVKESHDIIIKYDNGMFGLIDSDPTLHVWRAPFPTIGEVWPHPWSVATNKNVFTICSWPGSLSFRLTGMDNYIIQHAIKRYKMILCDKKVSFYPANWHQQEYLLDNALFGQFIFRKKQFLHDTKVDLSNSHSAILKGEIKLIYINVETSGHQWPSLYMNESYKLSVNIKGIFITAKETWGVLRALETVSQMAWRTQAGRVFINETKIIDQPRFKHRGVHLDTARHFIPKEVILKNLDAMEMNKMNVFHWHISDDQSFPLITDHHPELAKYGSYDFKTKVYRPDDVKEILEYARLRGIRIIPEIDTPSHTLSWRKSHPEVMTRCIGMDGRWSGHYGPLNMAAASTYRLLKSLFTDIVHLFPDQWIHLGSDEVATSCLLSNQAIQKWMQSKNIYSVDFLTDFYMRKLQNIITKIGQSDPKLQRGYIVWQEAYERNSALKKGTIVQLWKSQSTSEAASLARQSIYVIYSACWYLDRLEYGSQWVTHYQCDPGEDVGSMVMMNEYGNSQSTENWKDYILGGEAAMWTEFFDSGNVLSRIWPLACAAAERLWSPASVNNVEMAATRLEEMRCRMMIRSIPAGVAGGAGDCGPGLEVNTEYTSQYSRIYNSIIEVTDTSSLTLIFQLLTNLFNRSFLIFMLIFVIGLCIYLHRYLRFSTRCLMLIVLLTLSIYTFIWILCQHMLLY